MTFENHFFLLFQMFPDSGTSTDLRSSYLLNTSIVGVEDADLIIFAGTNPRYEAPLFNARVRKAWTHYATDVAIIGPEVDLTYSYDHLGTDANVVQKLLDGSHPYCKRIAAAKNPMIVVGSALLSRPDGGVLFGQLQQLAHKIKSSGAVSAEWKVFNVLHKVASQVAALDLGYSAGVDAIRANPPKVLFLLGADEGTITRSDLPDSTVVIYQGHHGDQGAEMADIVLPGAAYTEKTATYVNTEGRAQTTHAAITPPSYAREDWKIIRAISQVTCGSLPYDTLDEIRARMAEISPNLVRYDDLEEANYFAQAAEVAKLATGKVDPAPVNVSMEKLADYYMTNSISRASPTMAKCISAVKKEESNKYIK